VRRLLTALVLVVAGVGLAPTPATAASGYCTGAGVNVVIVFGKLGGGSVRGCGHGATAEAAIDSAGFALGKNPRLGNDFICTIDGRPSDGHCGDTDAYWALFVARAGGSWIYASLGAGSQPVSDGDTVSFTWQSSKHRTMPGVQPAPKQSATVPETPAPTHKAAHQKSHKAGHAADDKMSSSPTPTPTTAPSTATPSAPPGANASSAGQPGPSDTASPSSPAASDSTTTGASADGSTQETDTQETDSGDGIPWWIPAGVVVLLAAGGGVVVWRRRGAN